MLKILRVILATLWVFVAMTLCLPVALILFRRPHNNDWMTPFVGRPALFFLGVKVHRKDYRRWEGMGPCILVGNHQSALDLFTFGTELPPKTVAIGKSSIAWIPVFGWVYWLCHNLLIDRKNHKRAMGTMDEASEAMRIKGMSIVIFPEGTRRQGEGMGPFKKGAFVMAIHSQVPLIPVLCSPLKGAWHLNRWASSHVEMRMLEPIPTQGLTMDDIPALMEKTRTTMVKALEEMSAQTKMV